MSEKNLAELRELLVLRHRLSRLWKDELAIQDALNAARPLRIIKPNIMQAASEATAGRLLAINLRLTDITTRVAGVVELEESEA